jgi:cytochrome P450
MAIALASLHIWHLKDHEKYGIHHPHVQNIKLHLIWDSQGPIVRIAPNTLSFNTASALTTIYGSRAANVVKGEWYKTFDIAAGTYSSFTETDREKHAVRRRWMGPAFSAESLSANEARVIDIVEKFCDTLTPKNGGWGKKWNASEMCTYLGFDIMGALVFGCEMRTVQEEGNRDLAESVLPASMLMYWVWLFPAVSAVCWWCVSQVSYLPLAFLVRPLLRTRFFEMAGGKSVRDNNRLIDYSHSQARERTLRLKSEKQGERGIDFLSRLVEAEDKKTELKPTLADLGTEGLNMINAGADPFSGVLAAALFYLVHNTDALRKATEEVRYVKHPTSPSKLTLAAQHSLPLRKS